MDVMPLHKPEVGTDLEYIYTSLVVCILGGPGAGKGTQAELLAQTFGFHHLSTGQLLRDECARSGSLHKEYIKERISRGDVVPYELIMSLITREMANSMQHNQAGNQEMFILDGFPRDLDQAVSFDNEFGIPSRVIYLECDSSTLEARCVERGKQIRREDDVAEVIEKRIVAFDMVGKSVIGHYRKLGVVSQVDAERSIPEVFDEICGHLEMSSHIMNTS